MMPDTETGEGYAKAPWEQWSLIEEETRRAIIHMVDAIWWANRLDDRQTAADLSNVKKQAEAVHSLIINRASASRKVETGGRTEGSTSKDSGVAGEVTPESYWPPDSGLVND